MTHISLDLEGSGQTAGPFASQRQFALAMESQRPPLLKSRVRIASFRESQAGRPRYLVELDRSFYAVGDSLYHILEALREAPPTFADLKARVEARLGTPVEVEALREAIAAKIPAELFEGGPAPKRRSPFTFKMKLVPERIAMAVSDRLTWLFAAPVVVVALAAFVAMLALLGARALAYPRIEWSWQTLAILYAATIASTLFHELGHAAACRRHGCPHGDIGFAIYLLYPAFYMGLSFYLHLFKDRPARA